jgi:hypothetical protein
MGTTRTITATLVTAAAVATGPKLVAKAVKAIHVDEPEFVKAWWTTKSDICNVKVTVAADEVAVAYPANTATYSSFSRGKTLAKGTVDYTAFRLTASEDADRWQQLDVTIKYVTLPNGTLTKWGSNEDVECTGPEVSEMTTLRVAVLD